MPLLAKQFFGQIVVEVEEGRPLDWRVTVKFRPSAKPPPDKGPAAG